MRGRTRGLGVDTQVSVVVRRGVLAACAPRCARGLANVHVGPLMRAWVAPPTLTLEG